MPTRRTSNARHARSDASERRPATHASGKDKPLYVGGSDHGPLGGNVGNLAGFGSGGAGSYDDGMPSIGNVAGYGESAADVNAGGAHRRRTQTGAAGADAGAHSHRASPTPRSDGSDTGSLVSRRAFLYGTIGVGAAIAVGSGVAVMMQDAAENAQDDEMGTLTVPEDAVSLSDDCESIDADGCMTLAGSYELPYGTLVWANDDAYAACLIPTEQAKPIAQVALLSLSTGDYSVVVEQAVGTDEGFEIYDVRATSAGAVWTEADILDGTWRIYTAALSGGTLGQAVLAAEGDTTDWDTPTIAAAGSWALWQTKPKTSGGAYDEGTTLWRAAMGSEDATALYTSRGRSATAPYALADSVVITPRLDSSTVYHQLTLLDVESGDVLDTMTLPYSMTPLEAGYGKTGFMFSFDAIYSYGDGIANLGTYVPLEAATGDSYSDVGWFRFSRTPSAAPAWCGSYFMAKGTTQVCGFDLESNEYFAFDVESGADDYGEYLVSTGMRDFIVTFTSVDDNPVNGDERQCCVVKVWKLA